MDSKKRVQILNTAMMLFNENGFHATPTSKIAKKAKVSVGTLFNYFATKEILIEEIYIYIKDHSKKIFLKVLETKDNNHDSLQSMWHAIIDWGIDNPEEFKYLELFCHSPFHNTYSTEKSLEAYKEFQHKILKAIIPESICKKQPDYILDYIDNSIHAATRYLIKNKVKNKHNFINSTFDLIWFGLSYHEEKKNVSKYLHF